MFDKRFRPIFQKRFFPPIFDDFIPNVDKSEEVDKKSSNRWILDSRFDNMLKGAVHKLR